MRRALRKFLRCLNNINYSLPGRYEQNSFRKSILPGPADYNSSKNPLKNKAPNAIFGTADHRTTSMSKSGHPGPGAYRIPVKVADVPRYNLPIQNEDFKFV